jgi:hypothetical protein
MFDALAYDDFDRAYRRGYWRKIRAWLRRESNELLPYAQVRQELPFQGQRDIGLHSVPLDKIIGSVGRYRDFDRAFLPTQRQTTERWVNIKRAAYQEVSLPPVELYKIGDVYFVKDGNHRVSVARERGQTDIEAFVTEIDVPIRLTADMGIDDVLRQREQAIFLQETDLYHLRPDADLLLSDPAEYGRLHEHINAHRYYLGEERHQEVLYEEAVASWYDNVYRPLVQTIAGGGLLRAFPNLTTADLYLRVSDYQWLLREIYQGQESLDAADQAARDQATSKLSDIYKQREVRQIIRTLRRATWIDQMIREQERQSFLEKTRIQELRPDARIIASLPGKYEKLLNHINVHHYYLGLERQNDVDYSEAVTSWYDHVYMPLIELIREEDILQDFPNRTETDIYIWTMDHRGETEEEIRE